MNLKKIGILFLFLFVFLSNVQAYWGCVNCYYTPSLQNYRYGHAPMVAHVFPVYVTGYNPFIVERYSYSFPTQFVPMKYNGIYRNLPYPSGRFFYR